MLSPEPTRTERGFTLVELLVALLIASVIGGFVTTSIVQGMHTSREADERVDALTDLQRAGQRLSRELRVACSVETADADEAVVDVLRIQGGTRDRYRYRFHVDTAGVLLADVDVVAPDGTTTDVRTEQVARGITNGATVFAYRDVEGNAPTIPSQTRDITVTLRRNVEGENIEWTADLHLRNGGVPCEL